jgi:uncharacterized protein (DUF1778 family)
MAYHPRPDDGLNAVQRYQKKCDQIVIRPLKADGERIRSAASAMGYDNLTRFVMDAINHYINNANEGRKK